MTEQVEVTQADRDAAAPFLKEYGSPDNIKIVKAFARYRISVLTNNAPIQSDEVERARSFAKQFAHTDECELGLDLGRGPRACTCDLEMRRLAAALATRTDAPLTREERVNVATVSAYESGFEDGKREALAGTDAPDREAIAWNEGVKAAADCVRKLAADEYQSDLVVDILALSPTRPNEASEGEVTQAARAIFETMAQKAVTDEEWEIARRDGAPLEWARAALASLPVTRSQEVAILSDPVAVHLNMLRGGIAKPSAANIWHLYREELLDAMPNEYRTGSQERLVEAARPFADLLAGSKATASRYSIELLVCPEGDDDPQDWRPKLNALRAALLSLEGRG